MSASRGRNTSSGKSTRSTSARSGGSSRSSPSRSGSSRSRSSRSYKNASPWRSGGAALLVVAALLALLYAIGIEKGAINTGSEDPVGAFTDFLLSGFERTEPPQGENEIIVVPHTSVNTTATTAAPTTTTTTTATTTAATTTTTTTAAPTTTTEKKKETTTQSPGTTTEAPTPTTAAGGKNAPWVVEPNYESPYYIVVYAGSSQSVAVYTKDSSGCYSVLEKCFTCSTGAPESPTRTGQYRIRAKYRWRLLYGDVYGQYSSSISNSYLFHSVPYFKERENTLDMGEYDKLGTQASHGCIRLCVRDTKWIYDNCPIGTQVNIVNESGPAGAGFPPLDYDPAYKGWDPTDPDSDNPYK